jgi:hypothetical protein
MTLNGPNHDRLKAEVVTCRNGIRDRRKAERAYDNVGDDIHRGSCISLVQSFEFALSDVTTKRLVEWYKETRLRVKPETLRLWLDRKNAHDPMPAAVRLTIEKSKGEVYMLTDEQDFPAYYVEEVPRGPRDDSTAAETFLADGRKLECHVPAQTTWHYMRGKIYDRNGKEEYDLGSNGWYRIHRVRWPGESALKRGVRLFVVSTVLTRLVTSLNDLYAFELWGLNAWAGSVKQHGQGNIGFADVTQALMSDPAFLDLVRVLPKLEPPV